MVDPVTIENAFKLFERTCNKHAGRMHSVTLDWEIIQLSNPRIEGKIDQVVPLIVIDWK